MPPHSLPDSAPPEYSDMDMDMDIDDAPPLESPAAEAAALHKPPAESTPAESTPSPNAKPEAKTTELEDLFFDDDDDYKIDEDFELGGEDEKMLAAADNAMKYTPPPQGRLTQDRNMLMGVHSQVSISASYSDPGVMIAFYQRLFPFNTLFKWLNHSPVLTDDFAHREIAFSLHNDAYLRYQSFTTAQSYSPPLPPT